jgi:hypothetical protein
VNIPDALTAIDHGLEALQQMNRRLSIAETRLLLAAQLRSDAASRAEITARENAENADEHS